MTKEKKYCMKGEKYYVVNKEYKIKKIYANFLINKIN